MRLLTILLTILCFFSAVYAADNGSFSVKDIPAIQKQAIEKYKHIDTKNKYSKKMSNVSQEAYKSYNQKQMQKMVNTYKENILSSKQFTAAFKKYVPHSEEIKYSRIGSHDKLFIFISSSMPLSDIREYVKAAAMLNVPDIQFVVRGFIDGAKYIKPTIRFFYKSVKIDPYCEGMGCKTYNVSFDVNPLPFRKYHIDRVPAFVFDPDFQKITQLNINKSDNSYKLYGDVSLEYAIQTLYNHSKYLRLKELSDKFKSKSFYNKKTP